MPTLIVSIAFALGLLARLVGLPPLVGFLIAGFALHAVGVPADPTLQVIADLGVTLLMFTIGLKLKLPTLARPVVWAGTTLHTILTTAGFTIGLLALGAAGVPALTGLDIRTILLLAFALSFSSTVFAVKVLEQRGDLGANFGKVAIGVLIMQDVIAVLFLAFSTGAIPEPIALALLVLLPARPLLHRIAAASGHGELLVVAGLFLAVVAGYGLFDATGVKGDLGALLVGVLVGSHPKSKEMADALFGFKELLLVGFFVNVGLSGDLSWASAGVAGLLVLMVPLKVGLYFLIFTRFRMRARGSTLATLSLANISEFGLIVTQVGVDENWLGPEWLVIVALALSISLVLASPLNAHAYLLYERCAATLRRFERQAVGPAGSVSEIRSGDALIFGMGRVGVGAYEEIVKQLGPHVVGLDHDKDQCARHREQGRRVFLGDGIDHELWEELQPKLASLPLVVLALHDHKSNLEVVRLLNLHDYRGVIAAIATFDDQVTRLREAGARAVHNFYDEAGTGLAEHALRVMAEVAPSDSGAGGSES